MRRRAVLRIGLLAAGLTVLAGCASASTVHGGELGAVPDQAVRDKDQASTFDRDFERMNKAMTDAHPVRGTMFKHASYGTHHLDEEWDVEFIGDPAVIFTRTRVEASDAGGNLDMLHPAGSDYDYYLLGKQYASVARTPWARVSTSYHDPLNVCLVTGYQTICDMQDAITYTKEEHAPVTKRVLRNPDGTLTLITGVTLQSMLHNNFLIHVPQSIRSQFTPAMIRYQLAARFVLDSKAHVQIASITGTVPGKTPFEVEVGYQSTGRAATSDLPSVPPTADTTPVDRTKFFDQVGKINGADS